MEVLAPTVLALPDSRPSWSMRKRLAHLSDEALVALVARGDEHALAELYDRIGNIAYGLAFRVLRDERHAEDAVLLAHQHKILGILGEEVEKVFREELGETVHFPEAQHDVPPEQTRGMHL